MERIEHLAAQFPELTTNKAPIKPWNPGALEEWACGPVPGSGALNAARFVLSVWNDRAPWKCGRFDVHEALGCWDFEHRGAFLRWAANPWWA